MLLLTSSLYAEIIELKNGDKVKGDIIKHGEKIITVKTDLGIISIDKKNIKRIYIDKATREFITIYLKNKKVIQGFVLDQYDDRVSIMAGGKKVLIMKKNIERIDWKKKLMTHSEIRFQSLWRSILLPSLGQFYQKRDKAAWILAGSAFFTLSGTLFSYLKYRQAHNDWYQDGIHSESVNDRIQGWSITATIFILFYIAVWGYNIYDSLENAPKSFHSILDTQNVMIDIPGQGISWAINLRF